MYILYLDDIRKPTMTYPFMKDEDWVVVKSYDEFVQIITERGLPMMVSFDHDLADEHYPKNNGVQTSAILPYEKYREKTGMDCAKWLVNHCMDNNLKLPKWNVHSANPVGAANITAYLDSFQRIQASEG